MQKWLCLCFRTPCEVLTEEATLLGGVSTIKEQRGYGGMSLWVAHMCFIIYFTTWKVLPGVLDPTNELHLFALHFVFVPRINENLKLFWEGHNRGPLSSEHNYSPEQLWIRGMLSIANSERRTAIEFSSQVCNLFWKYCYTCRSQNCYFVTKSCYDFVHFQLLYSIPGSICFVMSLSWCVFVIYLCEFFICNAPFCMNCTHLADNTLMKEQA